MANKIIFMTYELFLCSEYLNVTNNLYIIAWPADVSPATCRWPIKEGIRKNVLFLGLSPKLWDPECGWVGAKSPKLLSENTMQFYMAYLTLLSIFFLTPSLTIIGENTITTPEQRKSWWQRWLQKGSRLLLRLLHWWTWQHSHSRSSWRDRLHHHWIQWSRIL